MKDPDPINLLTPQESRARGWAAEARDLDGHLCSQHAPFYDETELARYVRECVEKGQTITIWPDKIGG